jgi:D-psicose/D-tagatose/L-ribulose 3-epimerase
LLDINLNFSKSSLNKLITRIRLNYDGWLTIEAFGQSLEDLAAATKIWRRMYETEAQLAADGLKFLKAEVAKRW